MNLQVSGDTRYKIIGNNWYTELNRTVDKIGNGDYWNLYGVYMNGTCAVTTGTDIIGPIRETGGKDHSGGLHGDDYTTTLHIFVDGTEWDYKNSVSGAHICIYMEDDIYSTLTRDVFAKRGVIIDVFPNKMELETKYTVIKDGIHIDRAYCGLIAGQVTVLNNVIMPSGFYPNTLTSSPDNNQPFNTRGVLNYSIGTIIADALNTQDYPGFGGQLTVFGKENPIRYKVYLMGIHNDMEVNRGNVIYSKFRYTILPKI